MHDIEGASPPDPTLHDSVACAIPAFLPCLVSWVGMALFRPWRLWVCRSCQERRRRNRLRDYAISGARGCCLANLKPSAKSQADSNAGLSMLSSCWGKLRLLHDFSTMSIGAHLAAAGCSAFWPHSNADVELGSCSSSGLSPPPPDMKPSSNLASRAAIVACAYVAQPTGSPSRG